MLRLNLFSRPSRWLSGLVFGLASLAAHAAQVDIKFLPAKTKDGYAVVSVPTGTQLLIQVSPEALAKATPKTVSLVWGAPPSNWPSKGPGISTLPLDAQGQATASLTFPADQVSAYSAMSLTACVNTTLPGYDHPTNECSDITYFFFEKFAGMSTDELIVINSPGKNLTLPTDGGQVVVSVHSNVLALAPNKSVSLVWKHSSGKPGVGWTGLWPNDPTLPKSLPVSEVPSGYGKASATLHFGALAQYKFWTLKACVPTPYSEVCSASRQFYVKTSDIGGAAPDSAPGTEKSPRQGFPDNAASALPGGSPFGARVPKSMTRTPPAPGTIAPQAPRWEAPALEQITKPKPMFDQGAPAGSARQQPAKAALPPTAKLGEPRTAPRNVAQSPANVPTADLKVIKIYNDGSCNLWAVISNTGQSAVTHELADAYWINGKPGGTGTVSVNLAAGQSTQHKFNQTTPVYYDTANIRYQLDTKNTLSETNENDNAATATLTCKVVQRRKLDTLPAAPSSATRTAPATIVPPAPEQPPAGRLKLPSR